MVSRFLRPLFSWGQEAFRVTPFAVAASARSSLITALTSYQDHQAQRPHAQHPMLQQQRRHRWAGVGDFGGSETAVSVCVYICENDNGGDGGEASVEGGGEKPGERWSVIGEWTWHG